MPPEYLGLELVAIHVPKFDLDVALPQHRVNIQSFNCFFCTQHCSYSLGDNMMRVSDSTSIFCHLIQQNKYKSYEARALHSKIFTGEHGTHRKLRINPA